MIQPLKAGNWQNNQLKRFYIDTEDELTEINTEDCEVGSTAFVISESKLYMLNEDKEWTVSS